MWGYVITVSTRYVQGVHMIFDGTPDRKWKEGEKRQSKMVFIGRDLDAELFREGFEQCVAKDEAVEVV